MGVIAGSAMESIVSIVSGDSHWSTKQKVILAVQITVTVAGLIITFLLGRKIVKETMEMPDEHLLSIDPENGQEMLQTSSTEMSTVAENPEYSSISSNYDEIRDGIDHSKEKEGELEEIEIVEKD